MGRYGVSTRRACRVVKTTRSSVYYTSRKGPLTALRQRARDWPRRASGSAIAGCWCC